VTFVLACADLSGGVRVVSEHAQRLAQRGHRVTVVSLRTPPWSWRRRLVAAASRRPLAPRGASHLDGLRGVERRVVDAAPVGAADLPDGHAVVATWWETAEWVASLPASKGAKLHLVQHHEVHAGLPLERVRACYRLPLRRLVVSRWLGGVLRTEYGDAGTVLVPNGLDPGAFHAPPRRRQPQPTVGLVSSTIPWKRTAEAVAAAALARERLPDLRLVAFGDPLPGEAPPWAEVHPWPPQHRLRDLYASCDIWLVASEAEGFGLPALEAMACRTPVVSTPVGAAPELLASGGGALVPAGDPQAMAEALVELLSADETDWRARSEAAAAEAARWTWERAVDALEAALRTEVVGAG
jgi:glycosyltransferase involved in cell wall biosynthesis